MTVDPYAREREYLAARTTAVAVLDFASRDADRCVRAAVARNPHTPMWVRLRLVGDPAVLVRYTMASYEESPELLAQLACDPDPRVREAAQARL